MSILFAWATDMAWWESLAPGILRMNPVTAACVALLGGAVLLPRRRWPAAVKAAKWAIGCIAAAAGVTKLAQLALGIGSGIDLLIFPAPVSATHQCMMAPNTALCLVLLGAAITLTSKPRRAIPVAQALALAAGFVVTAAVVGYVYGRINPHEFRAVAAMSFPTAIGLGLVSIGILLLSPTRGLVSLVTGAGIGGATARRLLPIVTGVAFCAGLMRSVAVRLNLVDEGTAIAIMVTGMLVSPVLVVLVTSRRLHRVGEVLEDREKAMLGYAAELAAGRDAAQAAATVKADFLANMSHEIRTPLTAIIGFADLLRARPGLDGETRGQLNRIRDAGEALRSIVNDLLDFSKLEAGQVEIKPRPTSPAELLRGALQLFEPAAKAKGLVLEFQPIGRLPAWLELDPDRVRQILLNLIGNALKFTENGSVTLVAAYHPKPAQLVVRIKDTGAGLSQAQQDKLFQRFSQIDASSSQPQGGTGLGLAICKGLTEAMGGEIGVSSRPGHGSVFHFTVAAPMAKAARPLSVLQADESLNGMRLLVADDHPVNRDLVSALLAPMGVAVTGAADGRAAVEAATNQPFDVILLDIRMPGLCGPDAAALIRECDGPNRDVPMVAFTADVDLGALTSATSPFDAIVRKPIVPADLIATLLACADLPAETSPQRAAVGG